jgi:hypothetical protein
MERVESEDRASRGKLASKDRLLSMLDGVDLRGAIPGRESLQIDNSALPPAEVAGRIARYFNLPRA